jgi:hypothetical protein
MSGQIFDIALYLHQPSIIYISTVETKFPQNAWHDQFTKESLSIYCADNKIHVTLFANIVLFEDAVNDPKGSSTLGAAAKTN